MTEDSVIYLRPVFFFFFFFTVASLQLESTLCGSESRVLILIFSLLLHANFWQTGEISSNATHRSSIIQEKNFSCSGVVMQHAPLTQNDGGPTEHLKVPR